MDVADEISHSSMMYWRTPLTNDSLYDCKQLIVTLLVVRFLGFVSVLVHFDWLSISIFYATLVVKFEIGVKDL